MIAVVCGVPLTLLEAAKTEPLRFPSEEEEEEMEAITEEEEEQQQQQQPSAKRMPKVFNT